MLGDLGNLTNSTIAKKEFLVLRTLVLRTKKIEDSKKKILSI